MSRSRGCTLVLALWVIFAAAASRTAAQSATDSDGDGLPNAWEIQFGLDPNSATGVNGAAGDPDLDGITNINELARGTHPRGSHAQWFAEGASGAFFDIQLAFFNPDPARAARTLVRYLTASGGVVAQFFTLLPRQRLTINPESVPGLAQEAFSIVVEADSPVVADRTMSWDARHYGSHAESGTPRPSPTWYLAEGATHSGFDLFYLVMNPNPTAVNVQVTYLLPAGAPVIKTYVVTANSRFNIWVDLEDPRLASTDVSAVISASLPIVVERSMYLGTNGLTFGAGHTSAGVTAPALDWFLAEGATGAFFDLFVLIANPNTDPADVAVSYLLPNGSTILRNYTVAPRARFNIWVDYEDPALASTAVSTTVHVTNGVPVIVERSMWWPGTSATWQESHNSPGSTAAATRWALGEGEAGGPYNTRTYVLIANTSVQAGSARTTLYFEDGTSASTTLGIAAHSRTTIDVGSAFPQSNAKRFGTLVESLGASPAALVVERAMYSDAAGVGWAAGTNALGMAIPDGVLTGTQSQTSGTVSIAATDPDADEATGATGVFTITRSNGTGAMSVFFTVGGTATPGQDYRAIVGQAVLPPGTLSTQLVVRPVDDLLAEGNETVSVTLVPASGYTISGTPTATVSIVDNDAGSSLVTLMSNAARLLNQASFGPTLVEIENVRTIGIRGWLASQFATPQTSLTPFLDGMGVIDRHVDERHVQEGWFTHAITANDQLRRRVAAALLEIFVVGDSEFDRPTYELSAYWDLLLRNAFGNYRTLLEAVTLSPSMGVYLDMLHSDKEDPATGRSVNENYGREVLQLFSIGLYQLNLDGSQRLDAQNRPIPTYGQTEVGGFARAFTGWYFYQTGRPSWSDYVEPDWFHPMMPFPTHHSTVSKTLLNGVVLPAGQTPQKDLADALDNIFGHPNVGPFISKQLIQRLVTSNPSPAYVARVASVFNNNGSGVRGDLAAVVRAILLDDEARNPVVGAGVNYGKQKEPMIRFAAVMRAFGAKSPSGRYGIWDLQEDMGQAPFRSPSVFNFFRPTYAKPGAIASAGLVSPEFQITTEGNVISAQNTLRSLVNYGYGYNEYLLQLDYTAEEALAATPDLLLDRLNVLLMAGQMSAELRSIVREAVLRVSATRPRSRVRMAVNLLVNSPEYIIEK